MDEFGSTVPAVLYQGRVEVERDWALGGPAVQQVVQHPMTSMKQKARKKKEVRESDRCTEKALAAAEKTIVKEERFVGINRFK